MFGYVTVYKPELKIKEYEAYKGVYCTLCKQMGKEYGLLSRFLLSYDGAFYVMYKIGISDNSISAENSRCTFNPCKKCLKINCSGNAYSLASTITVILSYFKLRDNINDGSFLKKIPLYLLYPYFWCLKRKAQKKYPDIFETVKRGMENQFAAEKKENISLDEAADASAKMLGYLFAYGENGDKAETAEKFGYQLGRAVYFLDAFDDYGKDIKNGSFNPFKNTPNFTDDALLAVNLSLGELSKQLKTNKLNNFNTIADNIICDGMSYRLEKTAEKYRGDKFEQPV